MRRREQQKQRRADSTRNAPTGSPRVAGGRLGLPGHRRTVLEQGEIDEGNKITSTLYQVEYFTILVNLVPLPGRSKYTFFLTALEIRTAMKLFFTKGMCPKSSTQRTVTEEESGC